MSAGLARIRSHVTYANVMATIAVFVALGGGAYALSNHAPANSVNSQAIINGQVKSADVLDNSLTSSDLGTDSVNRDEIGYHEVVVGTIAPGAVTFSKLGTITPVTTSKTLSAGPDEAIVTCPPFTWAIRGGGGVSPATNPIEVSVPYTSANGQTSGWQIDTGSGSGGGQLTVEADCLE